MEKIIGKRIQEYRKKKGITQEQLSEAIGITPHYLSALERGIYNIKLETLVKILNYLNCSADQIFCDLVNMSSYVKSSDLSEKLKSLPINEQQKILNVVDTMVKNVSNW